eukprot:163007-Amphidinium_carterae.1
MLVKLSRPLLTTNTVKWFLLDCTLATVTQLAPQCGVTWTHSAVRAALRDDVLPRTHAPPAWHGTIGTQRARKSRNDFEPPLPGTNPPISNKSQKV